jgi:Flp pilus assembly protein TadG
MRVRSLRRDAGGSTAVEFALCSVPLLLLIVGALEGSLLFWTWEAMQGAASAAARCYSIGATSCKTTSQAQSYAVNAAALRGLTGLTVANVTVSTSTTAQAQCNNTAATVIAIQVTYTFAGTRFIPLPSGLTATACFPAPTA